MTKKVGLFGFGRTGSVVAKEIINEEDMNLQWVVRKSNKNEGEYASHLLGYEHDEGKIFSSENADFNHFFDDNWVDVIIDFSNSSSVYEYKNAATRGIRIVSAVTDYSQDDLERLMELSNETAVLYSPNITLGINFLIEACKLLKRIAPNADIEIVEEHFKEKENVSGTALRIAEDLDLDKEKNINSIRVGGIVGSHEVIFGLPNQTIRIKHESLNRAAFGQGAIFATKWVINKDKGFYRMEEAIASQWSKIND